MTQVKIYPANMAKNPALFVIYQTQTEIYPAKVAALLPQAEKLDMAVVFPTAHRVLSHFLSNPGLAHLQKHAPFGMH